MELKTSNLPESISIERVVASDLKPIYVTSHQLALVVVLILILLSTATVYAQSLFVSVLASPQVGSAPLNVRFTTFVVGGAPPYDFFWDFGDGTTNRTKEASINKTYIVPGSYVAIVEVTDSSYPPIKNQAWGEITVYPTGAKRTRLSLQITERYEKVITTWGSITHQFYVLTATLTDEKDNPVPKVIVTFYINSIYQPIGSGLTNSDGKATTLIPVDLLESPPNTIRAKSRGTEEFLPSEVSYYQLSVKSDYGNVTGSGWYKAGETATWSVTPTMIDMKGWWWLVGGKYRALNPSGSVEMTEPKEVIVTWGIDDESLRQIILNTFALTGLNLAAIVLIALEIKRWRKKKQKKHRNSHSVRGWLK